MSDQPTHSIAIIGGAVAGAEVAGTLADRGAEVVVFEQNPKPFGKIEDGLPRWHEALRNKEYEAIGRHLTKPGVHFVPNTRIGQDVDFDGLVNDWGFSGVVLACGAWRDRPLPVEGADEYVGKGLIYQNPFIIWFNHSEEESYDGPTFVHEDGALVVGGGLASIDVVKALMLEKVREKLRLRGIEVDLIELEVKGIPKILAGHGIEFDELGLVGPTLFYRRSEEDMPLMEMPEGADEKRQEKVRAGRKKMLAKAQDKYRFKFEPLCMPDGLIVEDGRLVGLRFRRTEMVNGRPQPTDETFERRGAYVISSIGSIPEPIPGIPMKGELFEFTDWHLGRLEGRPTVFSAGNVVTGKGNIVASRKHAREIGATMVESFLGVADDGGAGEAAMAEIAREARQAQANDIADAIQGQPAMAPGTLDALRARVAEQQKKAGYDGDYASWIAKHSG